VQVKRTSPKTKLAEPQASPATGVVAEKPDTYEDHLPKQSKVGAWFDRVANKIAPIRTHERVMTEAKGSLFGLEVGLTISQLELVRKDTHGREIVQVVNQDGSSNIELILGRKQLGAGQRVEFQGPALNTSLTPGELPLGARFIGVGLTSDLTSAMDHDAVSYTVEVKLTDRSIAELASLGGPGAAKLAADALASIGGGAVGGVISDLIIGAVPVFSAYLAVQSAHRAWHVCHDKSASKEMKAFAIAHAIADAVRIVNPLAGTVANAALVGIAAFFGWRHMRYAKHAPPTGPPPDAIKPPPAPQQATLSEAPKETSAP
jgi:hypothetical protein